MSADEPERVGGEDAPGPRYCTYTSYEDGEPIDGFPWTGPTGGATDEDGVAERIADALADVEDPEMPISVLDLGLVYGVTVEDGQATIDLTLTYTGCPARDLLQEDVRRAVTDVEDVEEAEVRLVWQPEWTVEMVTEDGTERLREFGLSV